MRINPALRQCYLLATFFAGALTSAAAAAETASEAGTGVRAESETPATSHSTTIFNNTTYLVYFGIACDGVNWASYSLQPAASALYSCTAAQTVHVRFKKSWLDGCPNQDQIYSLGTAKNYFRPTACGMDLYAGA